MTVAICVFVFYFIAAIGVRGVKHQDKSFGRNVMDVFLAPFK